MSQLWLFDGFSFKIRRRFVNIGMELGYNYLDTRFTGATWSTETSAQSAESIQSEDTSSSN
jgi:hypothetical protein